MENSLAVANYFIGKAINEGKELTPMKLIKLVYIAHGWHLALKNDSLIDEGVQAWKYGPVVPTVYEEFKQYKSAQVTKPAYIFTEQAAIITPNIENSDTAKFLDNVWVVYGKYNGLQLSTLTHQPNTPWDIVWNKEGGKNYNSAPIGNQLIKEHYLEKAKKPAAIA